VKLLDLPCVPYIRSSCSIGNYTRICTSALHSLSRKAAFTRSLEACSLTAVMCSSSVLAVCGPPNDTQ
jgi:hypothetical protein